jgi:hypothetical protein
MRIAKIVPFSLALVSLAAFTGAALAQGAPATDEKWYSVALSDNEEAFVNTNTVQAVGAQMQVRVKENYFTPRESVKKGKTYQSARTEYRVDCAARKVAMLETKAYAGSDLSGEVVQKASRNEKNLIWMDAPRATVFGEILDYTCKQKPAG